MAGSKGPVTLSWEGPEVDFHTMSVVEGMSEPFEYELELLTAPQQPLVPKAVLGTSVTVHVEVEADQARYFNAYVCGLALLGKTGENLHYRLSLRSCLWFLSRTTNCRVFTNVSVLDVVRTICKEHPSVSLDMSAVQDKSYPRREHVIQYRETDLHFIRRWLEHEGIAFHFEHDESSHKVVLSHAPTHKPTPYHPEPLRYLDGGVVEGLQQFVDGWEMQHRLDSGATGFKDYDFTKPSDPLVAREQASSDDVGSAPEYEVFDYPGGYTELGVPDQSVGSSSSGGSPGTGHGYAQIRLEEIQAAQQVAQGTTNARGLLVGSTFQLIGHPDPQQDAEYLVIGLSGRIAGHSHRSGTHHGGDVFRGSFQAMPKDKPYRPPRNTSTPVVQGAQTARVIGEPNTKIKVDNLLRVPVLFHWERNKPDSARHKAWVRVSQGWAGSGYGTVHVPRIDQEVIVDFLEGDPDQPIIVGRVYNEEQKPPYDLGKHPTRSGIKTRSTTVAKEGQGFNELYFEDKTGEEEVFMHAEKDHNIHVKNNQSTTVDVNRSASVGGDDSVSVTGKRDETIEKTLTTTVQKNVALFGSESYAVDIAQHIQMSAGQSITLTCGSTTLCMTKDGTITLEVDGGAALELTADAILRSKLASQLELSSRVVLNSPEESAVELDSNATIQSKSETYAYGGTKLALSGGGTSQIDLEGKGIAGSATTVAMKAEGTHEISGGMVKIN